MVVTVDQMAEQRQVDSVLLAQWTTEAEEVAAQPEGQMAQRPLAVTLRGMPVAGPNLVLEGKAV